MPITPQDIVIFMIGLVVCMLLALPAFLLIMHLLMPNSVMQQYFREPHYSPTEQAMLSGIPYGFIRVAGMVWLIAFPRFGLKRQMTDIQSHCPHWYVRLCQLFILFYFTVTGLFFSLLFGMLLYDWITG